MDDITDNDLKEKFAREKRLAYGAIYRATNKAKLLDYNKLYFENRKGDIDFMKKQRDAISISKKKRREENKKGDLGIPKRVYIKRISDPQDL